MSATYAVGATEEIASMFPIDEAVALPPVCIQTLDKSFLYHINNHNTGHKDESNIEHDITMYSVKDIQQIFKCGIKQAYALVNANGFPTIRIGNKITVEKEALKSWIEKNKGKNIFI